MKSPRVLVLGGQGYVGSALTAYLRTAGLDSESIDVGWRGIPGSAPNRRRRYQSLSADELAEFGSIILLAGHSSVGACNQEPRKAFANNVAGFAQLVHKLRGQKLVFASSISVYVNTVARAAVESHLLPAPVSYYDLHKQMIEQYAALAYPNSYALRFGTVCGPTSNIRVDLLLNSLVLAAVREGQIRVANRMVNRPLLGIGDLCRAIEAIVSGPVPPGCYNLASTNCRIGEVADYITERFRATCCETVCENKYDIRVDTRKFSQATGLEFRDDVPGLVESLYSFYVAHPEWSTPRGL